MGKMQKLFLLAILFALGYSAISPVTCIKLSTAECPQVQAILTNPETTEVFFRFQANNPPELREVMRAAVPGNVIAEGPLNVEEQTAVGIQSSVLPGKGFALQTLNDRFFIGFSVSTSAVVIEVSRDMLTGRVPAGRTFQGSVFVVSLSVGQCTVTAVDCSEHESNWAVDLAAAIEATLS